MLELIMYIGGMYGAGLWCYAYSSGLRRTMTIGFAFLMAGFISLVLNTLSKMSDLPAEMLTLLPSVIQGATLVLVLSLVALTLLLPLNIRADVQDNPHA